MSDGHQLRHGREPEPHGKPQLRTDDADGSKPRVLCVGHSELATRVFGALATDFEVSVEPDATRALVKLDGSGEYAVLAIATDGSGAPATARLLEAAQALSPTTARIVLTEAPADRLPLSSDAAFRIMEAPAPPQQVLEAMARAVDYHRVLSSCPAQPVEASRANREAIMPPATPGLQDGLANWHAFMESARQLTLDPIAISEQAPAQPVRVASSRIGLRMLGRTIELLRGTTVVGRSRTCHIPIPDPQISRRHACFSNDGYAVTVENLSTTRATAVNGVALASSVPHALAPGDRVSIGAHEVEVCALGDYCPSFEPTEQINAARGLASDGEGSNLLTLAAVANKCLALGQAREAERIVRPVLAGLLRYCHEGQIPSATDVELAVQITLGIAESNRAGEWIDYLFELFSALGKPMTQEVVDRLYRLVPEAQGVKMACFRRYETILADNQERFGPAERFLVRRIQGLERALVMSAHL